MPRRLTTEEFIERARAVHGNRYDYSHAQYVDSSTKVTIVCREHGPFEQRPTNHVNLGKGCQVCGGTKRLDTEEFIKRANATHGNRYDYSQVEYVDSRTNVTIICPDHGPFPQKPTNHYYHKNGCPECAGVSRVTTEAFVEKAIALHGDRYDYSRVECANSRSIVTIICPDHGPFPQSAHDHLCGNGCPECGGTKPLNTQKFIEMATALHHGRYDYSQVEYVNNRTEVTVICPIHGFFQQTGDKHLSGQGCPGCAEMGFNPSEPGILYYIAVTTDDGDTRYKIGITNTSVESRFPAPDLARIRIIKTWSFTIGRVAKERETEILFQFVGDRYYGPDILVGAGNTELFTHDVLGLDRIIDKHGHSVVDEDAKLTSRPIQGDLDI